MNPREITDITVLQELVVMLLNKVGEIEEQLAESQRQLQLAHDEIKRLKGGSRTPRFPGSKRKPKAQPKRRPDTQDKESKSGEADLCGDSSTEVDRIEVVDTKPVDLPSDAQFKGYRSVFQRDIRIERDCVEYKIARWYSPSEGREYEAVMPSCYRGQIGSRLLSFMQMLHHCGDMTHGRIADLLRHLRIKLSRGAISNCLTHSDWVLEEQAALLRASVAASPYVQIDSTQSKERGNVHHTQVLCGKYFSLFYTQEGKSRLDVYASLQGKSRQNVSLAYTKHAIAYLEASKVSKKHLAYFEQHFRLGQTLSMEALQAIFEREAIFSKTNQVRRSVIAGALAAGYYYQQQEVPIVGKLLSDEAREYSKIATEAHFHCWVHAIRHYRIMRPRVAYHKQIHDAFMEKLYRFYDRLRTYKTLQPNKQRIEKAHIKAQFDQLFSGQTDYNVLNKQMAITREKSRQLLAILDDPLIPLHNNAAERGARRVVRKRDISYHTWSKRGTRIRDAFMSLHQTANKLGISFLDYLVDRNSSEAKYNSLAKQVEVLYAS